MPEITSKVCRQQAAAGLHARTQKLKSSASKKTKEKNTEQRSG
jgi:hypothetical protein